MQDIFYVVEVFEGEGEYETFVTPFENRLNAENFIDNYIYNISRDYPNGYHRADEKTNVYVDENCEYSWTFSIAHMGEPEPEDMEDYDNE